MSNNCLIFNNLVANVLIINTHKILIWKCKSNYLVLRQIAMKMVTIDTDIPLPTKHAGGRTRRFDLHLDKLQVKESFILTERNGKQVPYSIGMQRNVIGMIKANKDKPATAKYQVHKWLNEANKELIRVYRTK